MHSISNEVLTEQIARLATSGYTVENYKELRSGANTYDLLLNGVKFAEGENQGTGGPDYIYSTPQSNPVLLKEYLDFARSVDRALWGKDSPDFIGYDIFEPDVVTNHIMRISQEINALSNEKTAIVIYGDSLELAFAGGFRDDGDDEGAYWVEPSQVFYIGTEAGASATGVLNVIRSVGISALPSESAGKEFVWDREKSTFIS